MTDDKSISQQPLFNIRSVSERTGIAPETLRAWERRYGYPNPHRNSKGYRLYTEDEIATLNWLKSQTETGMTIGQATKMLDELKSMGRDPVKGKLARRLALRADYMPLDQIQRKLERFLLSLNERRATELLHGGLSHHSLGDILVSVITPTMIEIGELWHRGEIPVAVEHFASQVTRMHLMHILESLDVNETPGTIVAACAPGEWHELGMLMVTILLRERGIGVTYLGPNLSLQRLNEVLVQLQPRLILFSANSAETAEALNELVQLLSELPEPKPLVGLGGQAFLENPTLINRLPGTFFGPNADDAVRQIEHLLDHMQRRQPQ